MEVLFTWTDLLKFAIALGLLFGLLKVIYWFVMRLSRRVSTKIWWEKNFSRIFVLFIPVSIALLLIVYVGINFLIHGILVVAISLIGFNYIRSFLNGVIFKNNPLVRTGNQMVFENYKGTVERLLPFGVILNGHKGKKYINYTEIEKKGFGIIKDEGETQRRTLTISLDDPKINVLDLLFENPLVSFNQAPSLSQHPENKEHQLQFTLEKGVTIEEIITFLKKHKINATIFK